MYGATMIYGLDGLFFEVMPNSNTATVAVFVS
jgi:hypothetical protein